MPVRLPLSSFSTLILAYVSFRISMMPRAVEHIERLMNILQTFPFSLTNPTLIWGLSCMSITFFEPKMTFKNFLTFVLSLSHSSATKHAKRNLGSVILMNCSPFWIASNNGFFDLTSIMLFSKSFQRTCKYTKIRLGHPKKKSNFACKSNINRLLDEDS